MDKFAIARRMMVDGQVRPSDVTDARVIDAFLWAPREIFAAADRADLAYLDMDLAVNGEGQKPRHILKPMTLAKLIHAADITPTDMVLDIACASGYSSAVLSRLAARVIAIESDPALADAARANLAALGADNVIVRQGPLEGGSAADAPFDVILINGAVDFVPSEIIAQLAEGGRLVCVERQGLASKAMLYRASLRRSGGNEPNLGGRPIFDTGAPLLKAFERGPSFAF
jgi:protein-L-isoaspartate(D-aspartate) O-methyltransferase